MKRGVQLYTVRNFIADRAQLEESLRKIKAIGYDSVQAWAPPFITDEENKALLDEIGLVNCSSGGDYEEMVNSADAIEKAVRRADIYGVNGISIGTLPREMRECEEGYHAFAKGVNKIAKELEGSGKHLLYHSHALEFFALGGGLKGMDIIVNETDPDGLHFVMDTHWMTAGGVSVVDWIYKVRGRMEIIHFKDYAIIGGAQKIEEVHKRFAEVGEGSIDWLKVVAACRDIGVEYAIVEQDECPGDPFDSLKISYDNMVKFEV